MRVWQWWGIDAETIAWGGTSRTVHDAERPDPARAEPRPARNASAALLQQIAIARTLIAVEASWRELRRRRSDNRARPHFLLTETLTSLG